MIAKWIISQSRKERKQLMQCSKQMRYFLETGKVRILNIKETPWKKILTFWKNKHMAWFKRKLIIFTKGKKAKISTASSHQNLHWNNILAQIEVFIWILQNSIEDGGGLVPFSAITLVTMETVSRDVSCYWEGMPTDIHRVFYILRCRGKAWTSVWQLLTYV